MFSNVLVNGDVLIVFLKHLLSALDGLFEPFVIFGFGVTLGVEISKLS
jgi:hypothetical protein